MGKSRCQLSRHGQPLQLDQFQLHLQKSSIKVSEFLVASLQFSRGTGHFRLEFDIEITDLLNELLVVLS